MSGRPSVERVERADPAAIRREVRAEPLPSDLAALARRYDRVAGDRDPFIWKWVHALAPSFRLPSVAPRYEDRNPALKTAVTMYVTLLDDLVDRRGDVDTFEVARTVPRFDEPPAVDAPDVDTTYVEFVEEVWTAIARMLADAPRHEEFAGVFRADLERVAGAIEFATAVNERPGAITLDELYDRTSDNMAMLAYASVDLMFSPDFAVHDLSPTRRIVRTCQQMTRIGNWITTWRRELAEGDVTSGVVIAALQDGVVTPDEFDRLGEDGDAAARRRLVDEIQGAGIEERLLADWERRYDRALELAANAVSIDLESYVRGMETVLAYHLASRGLK